MPRMKLICLSVAGLLLFAPLVWAAPPRDCTIGYVSKGADGAVFNAQKYYLRDGDKYRCEYTGGDGVMHTVEILRKDKGLVWSMNPEFKQYHEVPLRQDSWERAIGGLFALQDPPVKRSGTMKILNYTCDVYEMLSGEWLNIFAIEPGTKAILRSEIKHNGTLFQIREATEFKTEKPAAALFEIPAGYNKQADS